MLTLGQTTELLGSRLIDAGVDEPADEGRRPAAVALLLRESEPPAAGVEMLLIKRADNPRDPWSGHMALPGGRWEPRDANLTATALRETFEEVGVEVPLSNVIGRLPRLSPRNPLLPPIDITPFVAIAPERAVVRPNREVAAHFWVSLDELRLAGPSAVFALEMHGERRQWPAYLYGEHLIWGLTERILSDFFALFPQKEP